jgi:hypothetical protein
VIRRRPGGLCRDGGEWTAEARRSGRDAELLLEWGVGMGACGVGLSRRDRER